jgi:DNA polymerase elongation subunit (family B)
MMQSATVSALLIACGHLEPMIGLSYQKWKSPTPMTSEDKNYVAAWVDYDTDKVIVLERADNGKLYRKTYESRYFFYVPDDDGEHESIHGDKLVKAEFGSRAEYEHAKRHFPVKFESDIAPIKRILMEEYYGRPTPNVHYAFLDIETDYSQKLGFSGPTNPYAAINAITIWQSWTGKFFTYAIPPQGWTGKVDDLYCELNRLIEKKQLRENMIPEIKLCSDELELLQHMIRDLEDADIISGWNSEFFDLPYIAERLKLAGGERLLAKLDYIGTRPPKMEMINRFGSEEPIYKLCGKAHLDYMRLFQKFTFEGRSSYSLGNILQEEVGVGKLDYEGTLEQLYNGTSVPDIKGISYEDVEKMENTHYKKLRQRALLLAEKERRK